MKTRQSAKKSVESYASFRRKVWEAFCDDRELRETYKISPQEMDALERLATLGSILSKQDYVFILETIRRSARRD